MSIWKWLWSSVANSVKLKLIGSVSCIIMLAFGVAGYYTYHSNQQLFREALSKQAHITNQESLSKLELKVQEMKRISQMIVFNGEIEAMIQRYNQYDESEMFELYLEKQRIDEMINQFRSDAPYITGLYMLDLTGDTAYYRYNTPAIDHLDEVSLRPIMERIGHTSGELVWMNMSLPSRVEPEGLRDTIIAARWMRNSNLQNYGILILTIDESFLSSSLAELTKDGTGKVYLFNREGELLYANDRNQSSEHLLNVKAVLNSQVMDGQLFSISESAEGASADNTFLLVSSTSLESVQEKNQRLGKNIFYTGLVIALVASLLIVLTIERLLHPLADLLKGLQRLRSGKFDTRLEISSKDELAFIGESFNAMVEQVEQLIKEVYVIQLSERDAELKALQAQLNPHFLHNFFNEMYWKLYMKGEKDTAGLIAAVSEMLKHSLMPVQVAATVGEELRQINNYVKIQAELFETDLSFRMNVDEALKDYAVMRSLLQPLVENVFMHAFRNQLTQKELYIDVKEEQGYLQIEIGDNGCGMSPELIRKLLEGEDILPAAGERESLGVRNVARRIELLHGYPYRLEIDSEPGRGTTMRMYLPVSQIAVVDAKNEIGIEEEDSRDNWKRDGS